jgi:hypothetical protein
VTTDQDRLAIARWVFERTLAWNNAAEIKLGVVVTIGLAMLGGLASIFGKITDKPPLSIALALIAVFCLCVALGCAAATVLPRLEGPKKSLVYFGRVAELERSAYTEEFRKTTDDGWLVDLTEQIHRNAEIAKIKHGWVRKAMFWAFFSAVPWIVSMGLVIGR